MKKLLIIAISALAFFILFLMATSFYGQGRLEKVAEEDGVTAEFLSYYPQAELNFGNASKTAGTIMEQREEKRLYLHFSLEDQDFGYELVCDRTNDTKNEIVMVENNPEKIKELIKNNNCFNN